MAGGAELRTAVEGELHGNLLPFWRDRSPDGELGGFVGEMANDGTVTVAAPKGLILNSRILWSFSAMYRLLGDSRDLALALRAYDYLMGHFADRDRGGFHWRLDAAGRPVEDSKKIYGQAFSIYALAELHLATGRVDALEEAQRTFRLIERHAHDEIHGGYIEARAADWSPAEDLRLSDKDMNVAKSMNNHLHVLEAYTNLYRAWPAPEVALRLGELLDLFDRHVIHRTDSGCHLLHFFDEAWRPCSENYTYGHDIEAAWLLCEAADVLGDEARDLAVRESAVELARSVLREAVDEDGGLAYEGSRGEVTDPNREWWCQAEAVVGFRQAWELTGDAALGETANRVWSFIDKHVADRVNGEWFWRILPDGSVDESEPKVSEWKGPYHNMRMCLEMIRRTGNEGRRRIE